MSEQDPTPPASDVQTSDVQRPTPDAEPPTTPAAGPNIEGTIDFTAPAVPNDTPAPPPPPADEPRAPYVAPPGTQYTCPPRHQWGV